MAGGQEIEDETRNKMMQNLFGDQSEDEEEDEEEEVDSEHDAAVQQPAYHSDEGEVEAEFEGDGEIEGQGEVEVESEPKVHDIDPEQGDSEGERVQSSPERAISEQKIESGGKDAERKEEGYGQRVAEGQTIRANELLHRKREKVNRKYVPPADRGGRQLSPGFLEDALEEDDEPEDYYSSRRTAARNRFEEDLEVEDPSSIIIHKRIRIFTRSHLPLLLVHRDTQWKNTLKVREESEYETDGEDIEHSPSHRRGDPDQEDEYDEERDAEDDAGDGNTGSEEEDEVPKQKSQGNRTEQGD
ncbi:hypothetical protein J5N97_015918 [Dioscorea zingiberensis]|uniref:Uncharacterized protein n=1 Tax=Dioscorea zingiberensis TaxID=325984 RepID=A0A9D5HF50_9LILI|nr:hypothetical protein J5N97_015918 [Dioscorea zingiberensis]